MSNTPLTDAELLRILNDDEIDLNDEVDRMADFARTLERELNAKLIERLRHLHDDVQTIQRQIILERLAGALQKCLYIIGDPSASADKLWRTDDEVNEAYNTSLETLAAYEAAKKGEQP